MRASLVALRIETTPNLCQLLVHGSEAIHRAYPPTPSSDFSRAVQATDSSSAMSVARCGPAGRFKNFADASPPHPRRQAAPALVMSGARWW